MSAQASVARSTQSRFMASSAQQYAAPRGTRHAKAIAFSHLTGGLPIRGSSVAIRQERRKIWHVALPRSKLAFRTLPRYSMIALSTAVEPLRMANKLTGESVYDWSIVSLDGQPTPASNGLQLAPTVPLEQVGPVDILFVCGGVEGPGGGVPEILAGLGGLAGRGGPPGGVFNGGYWLA